ncbi:MAG: tryptophan-rich sensory protein [Clostridia bacterium]|nr:tryptophan-rich sensory protein [Clostridia bacterium]
MKKIKIPNLLIAIALPLAVGALSAFISSSGSDGGFSATYGGLNQPPFSPPSWLFTIVWNVLYVMMGIASYIADVNAESQTERRSALYLYGAQLALNFIWPIAFFRAKQYILAIVILAALFFLVVFTAIKFFKIKPAAGWLLIPYLLWLAFAAYLNVGVAILN